MEYKAFLIKYSEIGVKGRNRYVFENALRDQVHGRLSALGDYRVTREQGRIFVECPDGYDYEDTVRALTGVFGVHGISPVVVVDDIGWGVMSEAVCKYVDEFHDEKDFSFKVEARREDKSYPMTSPEICARMGGLLLERFKGLRVDVHDPEVRITVEVRHRAYIYSKSIRGIGGMPLGTSGRATLLLSGGIDSPVAGYMVARRGVAIDAVYFHAPPYTGDGVKQKVVDLAGILSKYTGPIKLHVVNFTKIQTYIYDLCPHEQLTIIMRRYMMKIAQALAKKCKGKGLVTGESIGQVASQTIDGIYCTDDAADMPVFRPLIGYDKQEIIDLARKIGTYETSIKPFEDCCTIFVARHPVTHPILDVIRKSEKRLSEGIGEMVDEAVEGAEIILILN